jgi:hypothetical protein
VDVEIYAFFTSILLEAIGELYAAAALSFEDTDAGEHWIGEWTGPRIALDDVEKRICHYWGSKSPLPFLRL